MIRKQDATSVIVDIAANPDGQMLAWDFVRKNWAYMFTEWALWTTHTDTEMSMAILIDLKTV